MVNIIMNHSSNRKYEKKKKVKSLREFQFKLLIFFIFLIDFCVIYFQEFIHY